MDADKLIAGGDDADREGATDARARDSQRGQSTRDRGSDACELPEHALPLRSILARTPDVLAGRDAHTGRKVDAIRVLPDILTLDDRVGPGGNRSPGHDAHGPAPWKARWRLADANLTLNGEGYCRVAPGTPEIGGADRVTVHGAEVDRRTGPIGGDVAGEGAAKGVLKRNGLGPNRPHPRKQRGQSFMW